MLRKICVRICVLLCSRTAPTYVSAEPVLTTSRLVNYFHPYMLIAGWARISLCISSCKRACGEAGFVCIFIPFAVVSSSSALSSSLFWTCSFLFVVQWRCTCAKILHHHITSPHVSDSVASTSFRIGSSTNNSVHLLQIFCSSQ